MLKTKTIKEKLGTKLRAIEWNNRLGKHEYKQRRLTFGMYMGRKIEDLPMPYLKWAIQNLTAGELVDYLIRELQSRDKQFK
jgi:uncharacterized protein (DUF3820 family)